MRKTSHDPIFTATARAEYGRETACEIRRVAESLTAQHPAELHALSHRVMLCNLPENQWIATAVKSQFRDGYFTATGRLWRCNSKLCQDCVARQSSLNRRRIRAALARQQKHLGERYYFATFTIPNPGISLTRTREIVNRAWTLFRKRSLCVSLIRGGVKSEEFTVTANGFHYHLHTLFLSKFLHFNSVRAVWTDCVADAFAELNIPFKVNNADSLLSVVIKPVAPTENVIQEITKYITKSDSWSKLRQSDLHDMAMIRRWHRMFELFGSFRGPSVERSEGSPILDTPSLSDGGLEPSQSNYWRDIANRDIDFYIWRLETEFHQTCERQTQQLQRHFANFALAACLQIAG